jgi:anti-sigma B factor antagonist
MNAQIRKLADGKVGLVLLQGEIDFSVVGEMRAALDECLAHDSSCYMVDLSQVEFLASDGLGVLVEAHQRAIEGGKTLDLVHPHPHVLGLLKETQLTKVFAIYESVDEAIASIG